MEGVAAQHGEFLLPESLKGLHCLNCSIAVDSSENQFIALCRKQGCTEPTFFKNDFNTSTLYMDRRESHL